MISVAIDGPAGAGKSTIAKALAKELGFIYVDTGALYRAVGLYITRKGISYNDAETVKKIIETEAPTIDIEFKPDGQHVVLSGEDVNGEIRTPEISMAASKVSAIPEVRAFLFELQRGMARKHNVIMDGRDIGTVVLPNAELKIFLTASAEERARRRTLELEEKGMPTVYEEVLADIKKRDEQDSTRAIAPLKAADDAILIDSSDLGFEEVKEKIKNLIKNTCL